MKTFNILFFAPSFYPKVGGLEIVADLLASGLSNFPEVQVSVITYSSCSKELERKYDIIRNPSNLQLLMELRLCDVFVHHGLSLKGVWPMLFFKRKWVVIHHLPYIQQDKKNNPIQYLKHFFTNFAHNISVSEYVKKSIGNKGEVIYNPYDHEVFRESPKIKRDAHILFVARLVSDKGAELLIRALKLLKDQAGLVPQLTIAGDGPEKTNLKKIVNEFGLDPQVKFLGNCSSTEVANLLNSHRILVIPSTWDEPFGIIALEGLACGCIVLASNSGGLPEALQGQGFLFEKNNLDDLTEKLIFLLTNTELNLKDDLDKKLAAHHVSNISNQYFSYFKQII